MPFTNQFWEDRRVFVTGATGLVGTATVRELLNRGAHVVGLIRDHVPHSDLVRSGLLQQIDVVHGCLEDCVVLERALAEYEIETVIHLAAQTIVGIANRSPLSTFESNIRGTWSLLEAARRCGYNPDIVLASSDKAYGIQERLPYTEESPLLARHPYDSSKVCAEVLAMTYHHTYKTPICVTRCGNFFGGGDLNWNRIVPGTIRSILRSESPAIRSDGSFIRDYLYVVEGARAYLHLAESMSSHPDICGEAFNFSIETPLSAIEMVERILLLMNSKLKPVIKAVAKNEIPNQSLSAAKARAQLSWEPHFDFDDSLQQTIQWYREYFDWKTLQSSNEPQSPRRRSA